MMAVDHLLERLFPAVVAFHSQLRSGEELVGDSAKGTDDNDNGLTACLALHDTFQTKDTFYGTYRCYKFY